MTLIAALLALLSAVLTAGGFYLADLALGGEPARRGACPTAFDGFSERPPRARRA